MRQAIPLTQDGSLISREWLRAFEDMRADIETLKSSRASAPAPTTTATVVTGPTYSNFVGDHGTGGKAGLVPAPGIGDQFRALFGDGTWKTVTSGMAVGTVAVDATFAETHRVTVTIGNTSYYVPLQAITNYELREDGGFELREDGGYEVRE